MSQRTVVLVGGPPWGFRVQGGSEFSQELFISKVNKGSKAHLNGIEEGDQVCSMNDVITNNLSKVEAHVLLKKSGHMLRLSLKRKSSSRFPKTQNLDFNNVGNLEDSEAKETEDLRTVRKRFDEITEKSTLSSDRSSWTSEGQEFDVTKAKEHEPKFSNTVPIADNRCFSQSVDNIMGRKRRRKSRINSESATVVNKQEQCVNNCDVLGDQTVQTASENSQNDLNTSSVKIDEKKENLQNDLDTNSVKIDEKKENLQNDLDTNSVKIDERKENSQNDLDTNSVEKDERDQKSNSKTNQNVEDEVNDSYKVDFPDVKPPPVKQRSPSITKSRSLDDDDAPKITELSECSETEEKPQTFMKVTVSEVDSEVEWESGEDLPDLPIKPPNEFLSTVSLQIEDLGVAETKRISPEDERNLRDFLGSLNLVNTPEEAYEKCQEKEGYIERKAKKRAAIVQHFIPYMQQPKFLDVIQEENSDTSDKETKRKSPNESTEAVLLQTKLDCSEIAGTDVVNTSTIMSCSDAELVFLDDSDEDQKSDTQINPLSSQLTPPPTPDKDSSTNTLLITTNNEPIKSLSQPSSTSSSSSSREGSQCTAKYNSLSPVNDFHSTGAEKILNNPLKLKELCFKMLLSLPFGSEIINELASVSKVLQNVAGFAEFKEIYQESKVLPFLQKLNKDEEGYDRDDIEVQKWVGIPTENDPNLLVCLSEKQRTFLDTTKKIPKEGDTLLDMHSKFVNRCKSYNDKIERKTSSCDTVVLTSLQFTGQCTNTDDKEMSNKLLAIIRDEDRLRMGVTNLENSSESCGNKPVNIATKNSTLPFSKVDQNRVENHFNPDDSRLRAKNLSEWLHLVRNKRNSLENIMEVDNNQMRYQNKIHQTRKNDSRRLSLPHELYQRQIEYIREKETQLQREIEQLEEEKRRIFSEIAQENRESSPPLPPLRKIEHRDRPISIPMAPTEFFRQQMYEEYMDKVAARKDRKNNKVIKISCPPNERKDEENRNSVEVLHVPGIEEEFMKKLKEKRGKFCTERNESEEGGKSFESDGETDSEPVLLLNGDNIISEARHLPKHLQEFVSITKHGDETGEETDGEGVRSRQKREARKIKRSLSKNTRSAVQFGSLLHEIDSLLVLGKGFLFEKGIWTPGKRTSPVKLDEISKTEDTQTNDPPPPPVWTPRSAGSSPIVERKEFRPVNFESPILGRKQIVNSDVSKSSIEPPWRGPTTPSFENKIPRSISSDFVPNSRLPRYQNPTITLLQKAREGRIPTGPVYIESEDTTRKLSKDDKKPPLVKQGEIIYQIKNEYTSESEGEAPRKMADLGHKKYDGIGPVTKEGIPITLRSEVKDGNQHKWYKKMYDTIHKQKDKDEYVTVRYKQRRAGYPYSSGYFSEPEPSAYDSDTAGRRSTLDRGRYLYLNDPKENGVYTPKVPTVPVRSDPPSTPKNMSSNIIKHEKNVYKNQPGKIENYTPGKSSISDKEAKQHLEQQKNVPSKGHLSQAFKDAGYDSDSTLVFRRKEEASQQVDPKEQKEAYKTIQKGGDVPLHGLRKPAPERPKDFVDLEYIPLSSTLTKIRIHKSPKTERYFTYPSSQIFSTFKRSAPSKSMSKTVVIPPSPPKRRSSRNSSTLRLISSIASRSPVSKRHECCFSSKETSNVNYLKEKITSRLSPVSRRRDFVKPKGKIENNKENSMPKIGRSQIKSSKNDDKKFFSSEKTFAEAKKSFIKFPMHKNSKINTSVELVSPAEVKKVIKTKTTSPIQSFRNYVAGSVNNRVNNSFRTKTTSCPSTPLQNRKNNDNVSRKLLSFWSKDNDHKKNGIKKIKTNVKNGNTNKNISRDKKGDSSFKKVSKQNGNLPVEKHDSSFIDSSKLMKEDIKKQSEKVKSDDFFQHLFLKDVKDLNDNQYHVKPMEENMSWIAQKTKMLQRRKSSFSEPSMGALMLYLKHVKPVSESKFRSLDISNVRSRSVSPKTVRWKTNNLVTYKPDRSVSLPSKIPVLRSPSPRRAPALHKYRPVSPSKSELLPTSRIPSPKSAARHIKHLTTVQNQPEPLQIYFSKPSHNKSKEFLCSTSSLSSLSSSREISPNRGSPCEMFFFNSSKRKTPLNISITTPRRTTIRSRSAGDVDEKKCGLSEVVKSVSYSELSDCGSLHSRERCNRFKELKNFYQTLEKFSEIERVASSTDVRPRGRMENEIVDYNRWKEVHVRERAEKEMKLLYSKLKYDQNEKGFLFEPKKTSTWRRELDYGLKAKEKSIEDIRKELKHLKTRNEKPLTSSELCLAKDLYKPLWRGYSVVNLASTMVQKRSQTSENRRNSFLSNLRSFSKPDFGFLRHIWSSLSSEQLNNLKCQLSEIYGKNRKQVLHEPNVQSSVEVSSPPTDLKVRRCSESSVSVPHIQRTEEVSKENYNKDLDSKRKRILSLSLCKEALNRIDSNYSAKNIILPKETRGFVASAKSDVNVSEATSPRTCYSLEISEDETEKKEKSDSDYLLVLTDKLPPKQSDEINNTLNSWAAPKKETQSTETVGKSTSETESASTDESTRTAIYLLDKKDGITDKIKYFEEKAIEEESYIPTVYKPADTDSENSEIQLKNLTETNQTFTRSTSSQDFKELFGEKLPIQKIPQDREETPSPAKNLVEHRESTTPEVEIKKKPPRRVHSDPELNRKSQIHIPGQKEGDVDTLRRQYEYPWINRRNRSRTRRGGVVSPLFFRAQDRLMPHINIISKIANLCSKKDQESKKIYSSVEELANYLGCPVGEVEKLRKKFDSPERNISLLGRMFTSSPNIQELKDIAPYLSGEWTAHKYPRLDDNTRSLSSPEHSKGSRDISIVRRDRSRPKSTSPLRSKSYGSYSGTSKDKKFDPRKDPLFRYCPEIPKADSGKTEPKKQQLNVKSGRPVVKFKGLGL